MSVWHTATPLHYLSGEEGELISIRVSTDPRSLESLLECLASLPFPVNPEIFHGVPTAVEFPAWEHRLYEVRDALRAWGFDPRSAEISPMLTAISNK